jgi:hypothetical protein
VISSSNGAGKEYKSDHDWKGRQSNRNYPSQLKVAGLLGLVIKFASGTPPRPIPKPAATSRTCNTQRELPADPRTTSPLIPPHAIQTTQCSASAPPRAPRLRCPLSATPLPAAGLLASARRALRVLPTTPSTARGLLSSSTLLTLLVSGLGSGEEALAAGKQEGDLRKDECLGWKRTEHGALWARARESREERVGRQAERTICMETLSNGTLLTTGILQAPGASFRSSTTDHAFFAHDNY